MPMIISFLCEAHERFRFYLSLKISFQTKFLLNITSNNGKSTAIYKNFVFRLYKSCITMAMAILVDRFWFLCDNQILYGLVTTKDLRSSVLCQRANGKFNGMCKVHSLSSGKVEMYLCATCHIFNPHVNDGKIEQALWLMFRLRMFKHWMEIVHNHDNGYLDWLLLFHQNVFPLRESTSKMSSNGKGSHLRNNLGAHSLSSKFSLQFN